MILNHRFFLVAFFTFAILYFGESSFGQGRSLSEQLAVLKESTEARSFDELMDSISLRDNGNFGVVVMVSTEPGSFQQSTSRFRGAISDPRVRKLYAESLKMGKEKAATRIEKAFRTKLKEHEVNGGSDAKQHGLHSTLLLASEFCDRDTFNQLLKEWVDWSREELSGGEYKKRYGNMKNQLQLSNSAVKSSFFKANSPELLMSANLVLHDQIRQGKTTEQAIRILSDAFAKVGWENGLPPVVTRNLLPYDDDKSDESIASFSSFAGWGSLGSADLDQQIRMVGAARDCLDPPGVIGKTMRVVEKATLDGVRMMEDKEDRERHIFKSGTRIVMGGRDIKFKVYRQWKPNKSPKKAEAIDDLDRMMTNQIPEKLRKNWESPMVEAKKWINEIPRVGTDKGTPIRKRWPDLKNTDNNKSESKEPGYWIEIEIVESSSLSGFPKTSVLDGEGKTD